MAGSKSWFLVHAKARQEETARVNLERQGYHVYLPRLRQRKRRGGQVVTRIEPLFPRYLFLELDTRTDNWAPIRSTVGVSALVRFGGEPAPVPNGLIALLKAKESDAGLHEWVEPALRHGQPVRVASGAFRDYEGIFVTRGGNQRVVLLLEVLGRQVRARVDLDQIEPLA
jgi:transcriptional antiterminator RfaH